MSKTRIKKDLERFFIANLDIDLSEQNQFIIALEFNIRSDTKVNSIGVFDFHMKTYKN